MAQRENRRGAMVSSARFRHPRARGNRQTPFTRQRRHLQGCRLRIRAARHVRFHAPQPDQALGLQVLRRTHHLPAARASCVGVVGPNGCGKSNIMDAVRWVLGESKASELRGESMQDVIFNGSGQRKPASRASVELVFDNDDARAGGQWNQFSRDRRQARADARRHVELLHQQPAGAPPRRAGRVPRHRPGPARLRHHRPGHDQPHHREQARGAAPVPRRGRRRVQVQGAPPRDREPAEGHAREPDARRGHPARAQRQPRQAREAGRGGQPLPRSCSDERHAEAAPAVVPQAPRRGQGRRARQAGGATRRTTRSKRAWPSCARSRPSSRPCARRTTPPATRCTPRRARWPRPRSR